MSNKGNADSKPTEHVTNPKKLISREKNVFV